MKHYSVLKKEVITNLNIKPDGIYIDATLGYGGHSSAILKQLTTGHLYAFDQDIEAINYSQEYLSTISSNFTLIHDNFSTMSKHIKEKVDGIIFDLGLSSPQIDEVNRGFSFMKDAPLDMRMDQSAKSSAFDIINGYTKEELTNIFYKYGEEKLSKIIANKIVNVRTTKPISTTKELVDVIKQAVGAKYFNDHHPERLIFQAIRIEVNGELHVLQSALPDAINLLKSQGRLCVITFHSLEDRITKQIFKKYSEVDEMVKGLPIIPEEYQPKIKLINHKPILPSQLEIEENSRSKSAKLRIIERI